MEEITVNIEWFKRLLELAEMVSQEESDKINNYNLNLLLGYISSVEHLIKKK